MRQKRLVQSPDKSRWYYQERFGLSDGKTDVTHEIEALINSEALALIERLEKQAIPRVGGLSKSDVIPLSAIQQEKQHYSSKEEV
ncbi:hypothetical protein [Mycolicibacterium neoaurum]|uniref:hypothetical protein n=1 Tax=Mycolicibacterium neoaurum TaxID=1795 RepID=UPI001F4C6140|nr:hypothetical protein [Mycolicibacterium neoaurum]